MRRLSFVLNILGFSLIFWGLDLTVRAKQIHPDDGGLLAMVTDPDNILMVLSIAAIVLFLMSMVVKFERLRDTANLTRTMLSYVFIMSALVLAFGLDGVYWYLTLAICFGIAGIFSHPFRCTPSGSIETLLRLILLSMLSVFVLLSTEAARTWAMSILILIKDTVNYLTVLYTLIVLPLVFAPVGIRIYTKNGGYMLKFLVSLVIPVIVISLIPLERHPSLAFVITFIYSVTMIALYGRYVRKLAMRKSRYGEITSETILEETTLSERILFAALPDDVYHHIFQPTESNNS